MLSAEDIYLLLSQAPCFVSAMDRAGKCVYSSAYAYGYTMAELHDVPSDTSIHPEDRGIWWTALFRARDRREVVPYSIRVVIPEPPGIIRLVGRLFPVIDPATLAVRLIGCVAEDMTHTGGLPLSPSPSSVEAALPPRPSTVPTGARWLAPMGEAIVAWVAVNRGWHAAEAIARGIGEQPTTRFRSMLTSLAERGILEASSGHGYRLAPG